MDIGTRTDPFPPLGDPFHLATPLTSEASRGAVPVGPPEVTHPPVDAATQGEPLAWLATPCAEGTPLTRPVAAALYALGVHRGDGWQGRVTLPVDGAATLRGMREDITASCTTMRYPVAVALPPCAVTLHSITTDTSWGYGKEGSESLDLLAGKVRASTTGTTPGAAPASRIGRPHSAVVTAVSPSGGRLLIIVVMSPAEVYGPVLSAPVPSQDPHTESVRSLFGAYGFRVDIEGRRVSFGVLGAVAVLCDRGEVSTLTVFPGVTAATLAAWLRDVADASWAMQHHEDVDAWADKERRLHTARHTENLDTTIGAAVCGDAETVADAAGVMARASAGRVRDELVRRLAEPAAVTRAYTVRDGQRTREVLRIGTVTRDRGEVCVHLDALPIGGTVVLR